MSLLAVEIQSRPGFFRAVFACPARGAAPHRYVRTPHGFMECAFCHGMREVVS